MAKHVRVGVVGTGWFEQAQDTVDPNAEESSL